MQMGGLTLKYDWLIKPSSVAYNEMRACQLTETNVPQKKIIIIIAFIILLYQKDNLTCTHLLDSQYFTNREFFL